VLLSIGFLSVSNFKTPSFLGGSINEQASESLLSESLQVEQIA
jgi:hypothetical protein